MEVIFYRTSVPSLSSMPPLPFLLCEKPFDLATMSHCMGNSPFHGIFSALNNEPDQESVFRDDAAPAPANAEPGMGRVAVDIYEQEEYYVIKAPIAGVRLADLDIEVNENVLTIRGSRKQTDDIPADQYYLTECFWGPFSRSVTLPCTIDPKKVRASFNKDGILKVLVPKEEKVKIVRISEA